MKQLIKIGKNHKWIFFLGIMFTILLSITRSFIPKVIEYVIDSLLGDAVPNLPSFVVDFLYASDFKTHLLHVTIGFAIFALFRGFMMIGNSVSKANFSESIARDLRNKMYSHLQNLSYSYHNNADTGDLIQRSTTDIDTIRMFFQNHVFNIFWISGLSVSVIYQMVLIDPVLTIISLVVLPITVGISMFYFKKIEKIFTKVEEAEASLTTTVQENLNGVRVVKAFSNEQYEIDKFIEKNEFYKNRSLKMYYKMANYWSTSDFITLIQYCLTLIIGTFYALEGNISTGQLIAFIMLVQIVVWPIRNLGRIVSEYSKTVVSIDRLNKIFDVNDEYESDGNLTSEIKGEIEFKEVSFKFDDSDQNLLDNISLKINPGETIALVGKTGSGKSTLIKLLIRLLDYQSGAITIDGVELSKYSKKHLRSNVGVILQEPFLYSKTVQENIGITLKKRDEKRIIRAAQLASLHNDIQGFEKGYETIVGEKGVTLSGGQKQRVAIARLLIDDRPIMVFDDSLSALDTETDLSIREALNDESSDTTVLIITHRITTAMEADRILVLEKGKIVENGTHEQLILENGLYRKLYDIQTGLSDELEEIIGGE
ncbi:ABC transporter ATP-binding protein [Mycoplasmatota bacterium zrk1]